jgi:uncharacterized YigZ family protein
MEYKTIGQETSASFVERRSKFIGYIKPVTTQEDAVAFIDGIRQKHWDATHNVYAYVLRDGQQRRYSDDGEPQGTAGMPVLDVLQKEGLWDVAVVATRYFGGVLLGAGGLVRAYSHTAKIAVDAGGIVTMRQCGIYTVTCDYGWFSPLQKWLVAQGVPIEQTDFLQDVTITIAVPKDREAAFLAALTDFTNGTVQTRHQTDAFRAQK